MGKTFGIENSAYHNIAAQFANMGIIGAVNNPNQMAYLQSQLDSAAAQGAVAAAEQAERDRKRQERKNMLISIGKDAAFMGANLLLPGSGTALSMADKVAGSPGIQTPTPSPSLSPLASNVQPAGYTPAAPDFTDMSSILYGKSSATPIAQTSPQPVGTGTVLKATETPVAAAAPPPEAATPSPAGVDWQGVLKNAAPSLAGAAVLGALSNRRQGVKEAGRTATNNVNVQRAATMAPTGGGGGAAQRTRQQLVANSGIPTIDTLTPEQIRGMDENTLRSVLDASKAQGIAANLEQSRAVPRGMRGDYKGTLSNVRRANARTLGVIMLGALAGSRFSNQVMGKGEDDYDAHINELREMLDESISRIKAY